MEMSHNFFRKTRLHLKTRAQTEEKRQMSFLNLLWKHDSHKFSGIIFMYRFFLGLAGG